jgi:twitching motility protein PilJ
MVNKTDTPQSDDSQNQVVLNSSMIKSQPANTQNFPVRNLANSFYRLGVGTKTLILSVLIATLPVIGLGAIAYSFSSKLSRQQIIQNQEAEAVDLSDNIQRFMLDRYTNIQELSKIRLFLDAKDNKITNVKELQTALNLFISTHKVYDNVAIFNLDGRIITQSTGVSLGKEKNLSYFQQAIEKNAPVVSKPEILKNVGAVIYMAAPVKDTVTGNTIAIVRTRIPLNNLTAITQNFANDSKVYYLLDEAGRFLLSPSQELIGKAAKDIYPNTANFLEKNSILTTVEKNINQKSELISYVPWRETGDLAGLKIQVILATDTVNAFAPQRQILTRVVTITALITVLMALLAVWFSRSITKKILSETATKTKRRKPEVNKLEVNNNQPIEQDEELEVVKTNYSPIPEKIQVTKDQEFAIEWWKLFADITQQIRKTLKVEDIYQTAVAEIRQALQSDRVVVYQLYPQTGGIIIAESVVGDWRKIIGSEIDSFVFQELLQENYKNNRVQAVNNLGTQSDLPETYSQFLVKFTIQASLVTPIITRGQIQSLLIAYHGEPRNWQTSEIDLFSQLATQIGYALEQSQLLAELAKFKAEIEPDTDSEIQTEIPGIDAQHLQLLKLLSKVESVAMGDLTVRADITSGEIGTVADFFNSIVESLRDIVIQVKDVASKVNIAVSENEDAIQKLAEAAISQTEKINLTLAAVDQITNSIQMVADNTQQAAIIANQAAQTTTNSGKAMDLTVHNILSLRETVGETTKKVRRLGESSQQISRVVSLINQIALQTNLLAINAGIEAAKAGEEGQGFAVVAEEVGELAARSAAATQEIEQIVEKIQRETSEVVQAMEIGTTQVVESTRIVEDAKQSLKQIVEVSKQIDALVYSISTATASQVETSQIVSQLMQEIAAVSQCTSDSSRLVSQSLKQTVEISQQLQQTVGTFKVD